MMKKLIFAIVALTALFACVSCNKKDSDNNYVIETAAYPEGAGTVSGAGTYAAGTKVTLTAKAAEGYEFVGWDDEETAASRTITVSEDALYIAVFEKASPKPSEDLLVEFYHYGKFYNNSTVDYELYITEGEIDEDGYIVGEGAMIAFDLCAPTTSTATSCDAGTYNFAPFESEESIKKFTFLEGFYYEEDDYFFPSYLYLQKSADEAEMKIIDGGSFKLSRNGNSYTISGTVEYYDSETGETGSYTLNYTAVPEFYDYEDEVANVAKSSMKKGFAKKGPGKVRRK